MKMTLFLSLFGMVGMRLLQAQGNFQDLDFESARVIVTTDSSGDSVIATSNALPGWSLFSGTNQLSLIAYNASFLPDPQLYFSNANPHVIAGNFDIILGNGNSISQTGLVPSGTESLLFDASPLPVLVSLGGQSLSFMAISNAMNSYGYSYTIYGADISGFAGQLETLTFSGGGALDDIQFSPEAVPEPSEFALISLGAIVFGLCRKRGPGI